MLSLTPCVTSPFFLSSPSLLSAPSTHLQPVSSSIQVFCSAPELNTWKWGTKAPHFQFLLAFSSSLILFKLPNFVTSLLLLAACVSCKFLFSHFSLNIQNHLLPWPLQLYTHYVLFFFIALLTINLSAFFRWG